MLSLGPSSLYPWYKPGRDIAGKAPLWGASRPSAGFPVRMGVQMGMGGGQRGARGGGGERSSCTQRGGGACRGSVEGPYAVRAHWGEEGEAVPAVLTRALGVTGRSQGLRGRY